MTGVKDNLGKAAFAWSPGDKPGDKWMQNDKSRTTGDPNSTHIETDIRNISRYFQESDRAGSSTLSASCKKPHRVMHVVQNKKEPETSRSSIFRGIWAQGNLEVKHLSRLWLQLNFYANFIWFDLIYAVVWYRIDTSATICHNFSAKHWPSSSQSVAQKVWSVTRACNSWRTSWIKLDQVGWSWYAAGLFCCVLCLEPDTVAPSTSQHWRHNHHIHIITRPKNSNIFKLTQSLRIVQGFVVADCRSQGVPPSMTDLFAASSWNILCQSQLYGDDWMCVGFRWFRKIGPMLC